MNKRNIRQNKREIIFVLLFIAVLSSAISISINKVNDNLPSVERTKLSYADIAKAIKANYDQKLENLSIYKASHYANRIYRISGSPIYFDYNLQDIGNMIKSVENLLQIAHDNNEIEYSKTQTDGWISGARAVLRRESLTIAPAFPYYFRSLNILRRASEYRICTTQFERLKEHVLAHDYTRELSDPTMIKAWAGQLANVVAWIKQLGGKNYSDVFINALQQVYPDNSEHLLSLQQYENKLYGLTHIILANSQYYQHHVNSDDFAWIFDYFDTHIDIIISRAKADVVAEVGIAYLLAGKYASPTLEKTKQNIAQQYNEIHHMLPSQDGDFDITAGSHRNILAIILLTSPQKLYAGPWLSQIQDAAKGSVALTAQTHISDELTCHPLKLSGFI